MNNFRTLYLYVISFITLWMMIGGITYAVNNITSYFYPDSYVFFEQQSNNKYVYDYTDTTNNQIKRENYKNEKIKSTVVSIVVIVLGGVLYKYHWNLIENETNKKEENI